LFIPLHRAFKEGLYGLYARIGKGVSSPRRLEILELLAQGERTVESLADETCPVDLDTRMLRREISAMYARVAAAPDGQFHFHRGPEYAVQMLGYERHDRRT
jgi:hypothetical protein